MIVKQTIERKLAEALAPQFLDVLNESHMHSVPPNSETHFKVIVVSDIFSGVRAVQRHQRIYQLLADELKSGVHALALHTYTPDEWQQASVPDSPNCMGGSKVNGQGE